MESMNTEMDKFDKKMIEIESKSFEVSMLISGYVFEILENFKERKSDLYTELPYFDLNKGYKTVVAESIYLDDESGIILISAEGISTPVMWDELNIAAKEIIILELHQKYKADRLYANLTVKDEIH